MGYSVPSIDRKPRGPPARVSHEGRRPKWLSIYARLASLFYLWWSKARRNKLSGQRTQFLFFIVSFKLYSTLIKNMYRCALWDIESLELDRRPQCTSDPTSYIPQCTSDHCLSILKHGHIHHSHYKEWSGNSAKVFVLSFCSPLCNFVHGHGH